MAYEAGELLHYGLVPANNLLVLISQSGESAETCALARQYAYMHSVVAVVNHTKSELGRWADIVLPLLAGEEKCPSNKTYLASLAILGHLVLALVDGKNDEYCQGLLQVAVMLEQKEAHWFAASVDWFTHLSECKFVSLIGCGYCLCTALQGALILKEMAGIAIEGSSGATFRHGPIELAGPGHGAIILAQGNLTHELGIGLAYELAEYGSHVLLFTDRELENKPNLLAVPMPSLAEEFAPYIYFLPLEFLAYRAALAKNYEPGVMRRISVRSHL